MYLKTLTLRGFKSFASATTLRFEPGITCIVGPNGSGKSNVVDAFSWVMGEQGVKTLRGGKMEDVVFAGTASRPPLGRAEVTLTIDNSDGALPIEYAEVTISRLLFRSGQSEYSINGDHCRLLDVQELLSDSGLGREMHVIVGQGQLDQVLHAGPEARRALIEEAAGVLKHRRRKEKALRKLEAMQANLTRLVDLTAELKRRLKPLGRQAAIARRAAVIQADLRDARLRLLADDYVTAAAALERDQTDEAAALARRAELERVLAQARQREAELDSDEQQHAPRLAAAQEAWFALSALSERFRGVASLAQERHSHLVAQPDAPRPGRDPQDLEAEAETLREQEAVLGERLETAREQLSGATSQRAAAETALADEERRLAASARAEAVRAERLSRLRAQVGAARSKASAAQEEAGRLADAVEQARTRAGQARQEYEELQELCAGRDDDRAGLAGDHEQASVLLAEASALVTERRAAERESSAQRAALQARVQALREGVHALRTGKDASGTLLNDPEKYPGVLGGVAALVSVDAGAQEAIAAALGGAADAVAVTGLDAAVAILEVLKDEDAGSAGLMIASGTPAHPWRLRMAGCRRVSSCRMGHSPPSRWSGPRTGWRRRSPGCCPASSWPPTWRRPGNWSARIRRSAWSPGVVTCSAPTGPRAARPGPPVSSPCAAWRTRRPPGWRPLTNAAIRPPSSSRWPWRPKTRRARPWPRPRRHCARWTRPPPRCPAGSAGSPARHGPPATRRSAWKPRSTRPTALMRTARPRSPSLRRAWPRPRPGRTRTASPARRPARGPPRAAARGTRRSRPPTGRPWRGR